MKTLLTTILISLLAMPAAAEKDNHFYARFTFLNPLSTGERDLVKKGQCVFEGGHRWQDFAEVNGFRFSAHLAFGAHRSTCFERDIITITNEMGRPKEVNTAEQFSYGGGIEVRF